MARKSLRDMSGIANTIARSSSTPTEKTPKTSAPALGALQGSLASIREIDPGLIDDWGPKDRLDEFTKGWKMRHVATFRSMRRRALQKRSKPRVTKVRQCARF